MTDWLCSGRLLGLITIVGALGAYGSDKDPVVVDLTGKLPATPYDLTPANSFDIGTLIHVHQALPTAFGDLDGDGRSDRVTVTSVSVLAASTGPHGVQTLWNHLLDPRFTGPTQAGGITINHDVDGDGINDVVVTVQTADRSNNLVLVLDPKTGMQKGRIVLPGGPDLRQDGYWDGGYAPIGVVSIGRRPALILVCGAEYDAEPRGVVAVDPATAEVLWRFDCGPSVNGLGTGATVTDLEGDGTVEIVVSGRGTNNCSDYPMAKPDDHSAVYVLAADGRLLWERRFGEPNTGVLIAVADFDGDGAREIAVALNYWKKPVYEISIWDHDGRMRTRQPFDSQALGIEVVSAALDGHDIAVGRTFGVAVYSLRDTVLVEKRRILTGGLTPLIGVSDDLPTAGSALVAYVGDRGLWLLSPGGQLLATVALRGAPERFTFAAESDDRLYFATWGAGESQLYRVTANVAESPPWRTQLLALVFLLAAASSMTAYGFHRRRERRRKEPGLDVHRQLLDLLQRDRHQRVMVVHRFGMLVQRLDHGQLGDMTGAEARTADLVTEFREHGLGQLQELVSAVEGTPERIPGADLLRSVLPKIEAALAVCSDTDADSHRRRVALVTLRKARTSLDTAVDTLWGHLIESFEADLGDRLRDLLQNHAPDLSRAGIVVNGQDGIAKGSFMVHVDPAELTYALDNLLRNATRALETSLQKILTLTIREDDDTVYLDVADTGCGIPADRRDSIWLEGSGALAGHARGLPRSRTMLARYGGTLRFNLELAR